MDTNNPMVRLAGIVIGLLMVAGVGIWGYNAMMASSSTAGNTINNAVTSAGTSSNYGSGSTVTGGTISSGS